MTETTNGSLNRKLNMALVGGGQGAFIGRVHATAAVLDNRAALVAGALSSNTERAKASAPAYDIPLDRAYGSCQELIDEELKKPEGERVDFISVATPNHTHFEIAKAAGFNVICDKPMTFELAQEEELVKAAEASGVVLFATHNSLGDGQDLPSSHCAETEDPNRAGRLPDRDVPPEDGADINTNRSRRDFLRRAVAAAIALSVVPSRDSAADQPAETLLRFVRIHPPQGRLQETQLCATLFSSSVEVGSGGPDSRCFHDRDHTSLPTVVTVNWTEPVAPRPSDVLKGLEKLTRDDLLAVAQSLKEIAPQ